MQPTSTSQGKVCRICGEDCSDRPRAKDRAGNYYCRECYDRAAQKAAAGKKAAAPKSAAASGKPESIARKQAAAVARKQAPAARKPAAAKPPPLPSAPDDDGFDLLANAVAETAQAPAEARAVVEPRVPPAPQRSPAPQRGPARPAPKSARAARKRGASGGPSIIQQPWIAFVVPMVALGALYFAARGNQDLALAYMGFLSLYSMTVCVVVLIQAFRESIGTGFLTLCLPFYVIYFVFWVNDNKHIMALYGAALLLSIAGMTLVQLPLVPPM